MAPFNYAAFPMDAIAVESVQVSAVSVDLADRLAETFKVLGDPTRLRMISALLGTELCVCDLAGALEMTQSAVSHQLRILRQTHVVRSRKVGRQVYYALDDRHIEELFQRGLEHVSHG